MSVAVRFDKVTKFYDSHMALTGGIKNFILNFHKRNQLRRTTQVLNNLSFEIERGSTVGIVGKNGAGKSTLLSMIAGVLMPNEGRVEVFGHVSSLLELGAGFHSDLTGRENIELYGVILGFTRSEIRSCRDNVIDYSELGDFIDVPIRFYSSGMLARLGFSVISQMNPDILIVDEVLSVGDHKFQAKCQKTMEEFKTQGKTIIFVSHAASEVVRFCDRAIYIDGHEIVADGEPEMVMKAYLGKDFKTAKELELEAKEKTEADQELTPTAH